MILSGWPYCTRALDSSAQGVQWTVLEMHAHRECVVIYGARQPKDTRCPGHVRPCLGLAALRMELWHRRTCLSNQASDESWNACKEPIGLQR